MALRLAMMPTNQVVIIWQSRENIRIALSISSWDSSLTGGTPVYMSVNVPLGKPI
ncbi:MAG: hypothetical protein OXH41_11410 [Chloroflexi bacterium]|nr:hypothetical protein [Chloroflexota bacterium]